MFSVVTSKARTALLQVNYWKVKRCGPSITNVSIQKYGCKTKAESLAKRALHVPIEGLPVMPDFHEASMDMQPVSGDVAE
jgi:hypothetical protein